jgi:hypothetical protein
MSSVQGCRNQEERGLSAPQFLANQSTLSKPGGQIMATTLLGAPPPRFSDLLTALVCKSSFSATIATKGFENGYKWIMYV